MSLSDADEGCREDALLLQTVRATVQKHFVDSALLGAYEPSRKKVGGLVAVSLGPGLTELVAFHNTDHLPLAFSTGRSTRHRLLTRPDGEDFVLESFLLRGAE